eukprot:g78417.t1
MCFKEHSVVNAKIADGGWNGFFFFFKFVVIECTWVSMMQEFATFLFKYLQNDDDPLSFYRPGTALQFLSAAKCGLEKLFQNHCFDGWYYDLRRVLNFKFMTRCFNLGLLAKEKAPGLTRSDNMNISCWLLLHARNAHVAEDEKTLNKYIRWRAYLNNLTQAVGRASQLGKTQYQYVSFDTQFQCLAFDWAQDKVGKMKILHVYASRDSFVDCAFHSLTEYFWSTSVTSSTNSKTSKRSPTATRSMRSAGGPSKPYC